jgi:hypothetical protein
LGPPVGLVSFFILAQIYVLKLADMSLSELELYQTVWWDLSFTIELLHGRAPTVSYVSRAGALPNRPYISMEGAFTS